VWLTKDDKRSEVLFHCQRQTEIISLDVIKFKIMWSDVKILKFSGCAFHNNFDIIQDIKDKFGLLNINELNFALPYSDTSKFSSQIVKKMGKIDVLNIKSRYTVFNENSFKHLFNLNELNIEITGGIKSNESVDLVLKDCKQLQKFHLSGIDKFVRVQLYGLWRMMSEIEITKNNITHLNENIFRFNEQVAFIDLSENKLRTLPLNLFAHTPQLEELLLTKNQIERIEEGHFAYNSMLEVLDISENNLNFINRYVQNFNIIKL
jgi:hypothetical protein